ncbi:hypothetical protein C0J52_22411 [Blattella germanica]|nr:hypothetical protein C0J52_22411 [Blattella germanica]
MSYCTEKVNEFVFTLQKLRDTEFKEMWSKAVSDNQKDGDESWSKRRNNCSLVSREQLYRSKQGSCNKKISEGNRKDQLPISERVRPSLVMTSLPGPSSVDIASIPHSSSMHLNPVVAIRIVPPLAETVEMPSPQLTQSGITSSGVQNTIVGQSLHISQQNIPVLGNDTSTVLGSGQLETNEVDLALNRLEDISNKVKQLHNREDYFDYFGKYVAALLRSLPIQKAMNMQQEVIKLILTTHTNPEVLSKELVSPLARPSLTNDTPSSDTQEAVDLEERLLPAPQSLEPSSVQNVNGDISFSISQQNEKGEKRPHPDDMSHKVENKHAKFCDLLEQTGEIEESLKRLENISNQINQLCGRDDHFDDFGRYSASLLRGLNTQKAIEMQGEVIALILK